MYEYDAWGNIAKKWVYRGISTDTPAASDLIKEYAYVYSSTSDTTTTWKDLLTSYDGEAIVYDAIGNPTTYRGKEMTWQGRELKMWLDNDAGVGALYSYDASGIRTQKLYYGNLYNYYYVEGKLMYEEKLNEYELFYTYDANGYLSGIKRVLADGTTENFAVLCNMFGDVIAIYSSADNLVAKYTYDTWGKLLSIMDANESDISSTSGIWLQNSIRYRGYVYDNETGWYYLQSRYYDPEICRFINADGLLVANNNFSINLFSYAECNPLVNIDPTGTCPYNGSMGDFRRLEQGLPSMDCDCSDSQIYAYSEHKKKGTTNPANKEKHQNAESRRKRDSGGEKGDARRKPNPNKRRQFNIEVLQPALEIIVCGVAIIGGTATVVYLVANNATGVGIADDALIPVVTKIIWDVATKKVTA